MKKILYIAGSIFLLLLMAALTQFHGDVPFEELKPAYAPPPSKFMMMDGATVHYRDEGTGFPVVLIHGMSSSLHTWQGWTDILSKRYRVIRMDLPGFGLTGPNYNNKYSLDYYESFVSRFLDSLGIKECYMAGNSLGGFITWNYALHHQQQVKKIVLLDAAGYPLEREPLVFALARNKFMGKIARYITPRFLVTLSMRQVYGDPANISDSATERYFKLALRQGNRQALVAMAENIRFDDSLSIQQIKTPTLIEWGEKDRWIPVEDARKFKRDIPGSKLVTYPGIGHIPMEELPVQSCTDAELFLDQPLDTVNVH